MIGVQFYRNYVRQKEKKERSKHVSAILDQRVEGNPQLGSEDDIFKFGLKKKI